jgi:hypothetical protein
VQGTMTKKQLREMAQAIGSKVGAKRTDAFIGSWSNGAGCSLEIYFQTANDGERIDVHKWDAEQTCSVRHIFGSWYRPSPRREGVEYSRADGVEFTPEAITAAITAIYQPKQVSATREP